MAIDEIKIYTKYENEGRIAIDLSTIHYVCETSDEKNGTITEVGFTNGSSVLLSSFFEQVADTWADYKYRKGIRALTK